MRVVSAGTVKTVSRVPLETLNLSHRLVSSLWASTF